MRGRKRGGQPRSSFEDGRLLGADARGRKGGRRFPSFSNSLPFRMKGGKRERGVGEGKRTKKPARSKTEEKRERRGKHSQVRKVFRGPQRKGG